jgi:hypothetical protein
LGERGWSSYAIQHEARCDEAAELLGADFDELLVYDG